MGKGLAAWQSRKASSSYLGWYPPNAPVRCCASNLDFMLLQALLIVQPLQSYLRPVCNGLDLIPGCCC